ncbi:N-6 DNA methylase [Nonomuraea monospora]|uniref:site-specific DNA-methyltransferase (adenine-specific) n=1 Tax=Nonomuraea monospora TaxID=568818 RepID=A0ABN3CPT9_9ACTN
MSSVRTETETVVKRVLPYLRRRGYDPEKDIDFETPVQSMERYTKGYVDLLVTCGKANPLFVIEAKRNGKRLNRDDAKQAINYGKAVKAPFVAVTNGQIVQVFHTDSGQPIQWNGRIADKIPSKDQIDAVIRFMRRKKDAINIPLGDGDASLPFRPSLPLKQLNDLFSRCHNKIRNIEKNEENSFSDFSKILFLKLLEEKADTGNFQLPYTYYFWELAEKPATQADQVKTAILQMLSQIKGMGYGDVLSEDLHLKNPSTFRYIVQELAKVSLVDSDHDVKGTAFEYFVRATLKGKKLGQYFTPRPVVELMADLIGHGAIVDALRSGDDVRVADPACGTGGFLVYLLRASLKELNSLLAHRKITRAAHNKIASKLMREVFHGSDANEGVASAAKMNMIVAGDGHTNIRCENSTLPKASLWPMGDTYYDFILTNPPFGTSEGDALPREDASRYPVSGGRGQHLFIQRMIMAAKPGGLVCTVIDEGLLNTDSGAELRRWVMQHAELLAVLQLPEETFKPNKINVRSSVLLLRKRDTPDIDLLDSYPVAFGVLESLGYHGSGEAIRGFDFSALRTSMASDFLKHELGAERSGLYWRAFDVQSTDIAVDETSRWDRKYWELSVRNRITELLDAGASTLATLNILETRRGRSPASSLYVDEPEGHAVVIKAGSNLNRYGEITLDGADWIEKATYDEMPDDVRLQKGDVLIASTGDGTLGKTAVWDLDHKAIADSHVTVIRVNASAIDPYYLADYLRCGFGQEQIRRLYTGSTGLIELTPEHVKRIVVAELGGITEQAELSKELRSAETGYRRQLDSADSALQQARSVFVERSSKKALF